MRPDVVPPPCCLSSLCCRHAACQACVVGMMLSALAVSQFGTAIAEISWVRDLLQPPEEKAAAQPNI